MEQERRRRSTGKVDRLPPELKDTVEQMLLTGCTYTLTDKEKIMQLNTFEKVIFAILLYSMLNLCAWIFQTINVRGFQTSRFVDLKNSADKGKEHSWQIYYEWQEIKRKADMFVSFVIYTKQWIIAVIILTVIFSISLPTEQKADSTVVKVILEDRYGK